MCVFVCYRRGLGEGEYLSVTNSGMLRHAQLITLILVRLQQERTKAVLPTIIKCGNLMVIYLTLMMCLFMGTVCINQQPHYIYF